MAHTPPFTDRLLRHTAIRASAGSGKTFALAHRYLSLMAAGVAPDRMIAMTFSRKAAGEIFDAIVGYLCAAIGSPPTAAATAVRLGRPSLAGTDFLTMLRRLTDRLHRTHIGTLDSFMVSVIRAFPLELGLASDVRLMEAEGAEARTVRQEILERIFRHPEGSGRSRREFLEAFKLATFGQEEKGLARTLDRFVAEHLAQYQALPDAAAWGSPECIWPAPPDWLAPVRNVAQAAASVREALRRQDAPEDMLERWDAFCSAVETYTFESPWSKEIAYLFEKLAPELDALRAGSACVKIGRAPCALDRTACAGVVTLMHHVLHTEILRAVRRTRGLFQILDRYERVYDRLARGRGRLTFDDVQFLLSDAHVRQGGKVLSRCRDDAAKLYIDYRLDCQLDHWLLDEFQDTSDVQWQALANLVDEVLQDAGGDRSFFFVGDVKQAIYGWRGGNARLFEKVRAQYGAQIEFKRLDASFRSCPAVLDAVNGVFGALPAGDLPPGAVRAWAAEWRDHAAAAHLKTAVGYAAVLEPESEGGAHKPTEAERFRLAAALITEIDPLPRGLSVAVLVRKNESGRKAVDTLRRECRGLTVIHEGKAPIANNPVAAALLSLVKLAEHPADTFARQHLRMTPLRTAVAQLGREGDLSYALLRRIHDRGFEAFIRYWGAVLAQATVLDDFGRLRLNDLIEAAGQFDEEGGGNGAAFLRFIGNYAIRDLAAEGAVTVMTVHQSKGLGFDVVILPDLMDGSLVRAHTVDLVTRRDPQTQRPHWLLSMPRRAVAENEPVLHEALAQVDEASCFESLCVLYVAMTRAKRALYMVTSYPGKSSRAMTPAALIKTQLAGDPKPVGGTEHTVDGVPCRCVFDAGDPRWYAGCAAGPLAAAAPPLRVPDGFADSPSRRTRLARVAPSQQDAAPHSAGWLFAGENRKILDFGQAIHALFEAVEWIETADIEAILAAWLAASGDPPDVQRDAGEQFRHVLTDAGVRRLLSRPTGQAVTLWREKRFEVVLDGRWVTGAFDRVAIYRNAAHAPQRAVVIDYKSNRIATPAACAATAEAYRPQLDLYARALSTMLRIPPAAIERKLLFTRAGHVVDL